MRETKGNSASGCVVTSVEEPISVGVKVSDNDGNNNDIGRRKTCHLFTITDETNVESVTDVYLRNLRYSRFSEMQRNSDNLMRPCEVLNLNLLMPTLDINNIRDFLKCRKNQLI